MDQPLQMTRCLPRSSPLGSPQMPPVATPSFPSAGGPAGQTTIIERQARHLIPVELDAQLAAVTGRA